MENIVSILDHMPVGFRFRPTDEELVSYYLKHKLLGDDFSVQVIPEIDLCRVEPWDVPAKSVIKSDDPEWFFFSSVDYKYSNSKRVNRTTEHGFWKATGNDRKIRIGGTNNVIGTKKTLVFHEGRVPRGVKTNWVIHEYHALTSHESQRTFVLCRLMKKFERKHEGGIEAPNLPDYGNPIPAEQIPSVVDVSPRVIVDPDFPEDIFLPPEQQSPVGIDLGELFLNPSALDACFGNESSNAQIPFRDTDDEDEFVNSIWVDDEELVINEERRHCFVNRSTQPKSLSRVYNASSGTDAEVVSNLHANICSGEYSGGMSSLDSNHEAHKGKKESIIQDDFWAVETSSCDSTADEHIEISSSSSTRARLENRCNPRPDNFILQKTVAGRPQTQKKVSNNAVSHVETRRELVTVKSEKDQKNAQNSSSRRILKTGSHQSSDVNSKGSFLYMETISSNQNLFPRSVYLFNVVIGIVLLIVISLDVLLS
ncbi:NAC domain-containing protein [Vigna angularis]|uniref:NAC domain-containing protein n=2 Tax=Phaseolus angularis TaxID=3914 RepID=A0A8T0JSB8_PHAAN|nr:NAC domain-containing protein 6-like [Vigna angularis]KAG2380117.1 NAC domain-containing protein [Vigna angularis]BAT98206.1 hypothetical protein VIGAN_09184500 [Vigna angularis var. angularis]